MTKEKWLEVRKWGKQDFIWKHGVLRWGIITGLTYALVMALLNPMQDVVWTMIIGLLLFPIAGRWVGKSMWEKAEKKYGIS